MFVLVNFWAAMNMKLNVRSGWMFCRPIWSRICIFSFCLLQSYSIKFILNLNRSYFQPQYLPLKECSWKINWWLLLILLLFVVSLRRKLLKRLTPKNEASIQIQKVAIFYSDRKKINLIPQKNHSFIAGITIEYFSMSVYTPFIFREHFFEEKINIATRTWRNYEVSKLNQ